MIVVETTAIRCQFREPVPGPDTGLQAAFGRAHLAPTAVGPRLDSSKTEQPFRRRPHPSLRLVKLNQTDPVTPV